MTLIKDAEHLSLPFYISPLSFLSPLHFSISCIHPSFLPLSLSSPVTALFIHTSVIHLLVELYPLDQGKDPLMCEGS